MRSIYKHTVEYGYKKYYSSIKKHEAFLDYLKRYDGSNASEYHRELSHELLIVIDRAEDIFYCNMLLSCLFDKSNIGHDDFKGIAACYNYSGYRQVNKKDNK